MKSLFLRLQIIIITNNNIVNDTFLLLPTGSSRVAPLAGLRLAHIRVLRAAKGARRAAALRASLRRTRKEPRRQRPVAALVLPAAGQGLLAPTAKKLLLRLRLKHLLLALAAWILSHVGTGILRLLAVLALCHMALGGVQTGKGLPAGAAQVRPLARVRADVSLQVA